MLNRSGKIYGLLSTLMVILAGIVAGGFLGRLLGGVSFLSWLDYGKSFGLEPPVVIDLSIIRLTLGLSFDITICGAIGIIIGLIIFRLLMRQEQNMKKLNMGFSLNYPISFLEIKK